MRLNELTNRAKRIKLKFISVSMISGFLLMICFPWFGRILTTEFTNNYYTAYINGEKIGSSTDRQELEQAVKEARVKINRESANMQFLDAEIEIQTENRVFGKTKSKEQISQCAYYALKESVGVQKQKAYLVDIDGYVITLGSLSEVEYLFDTIKNRYSGADTFDTELHVEEEAGQTALTMNINNADIQAVDAPVVMVGVEEGVKNAEAPETSDIIGQPDGVLDVQFEEEAVIIPCYVNESQISELNTAIDMVLQGSGSGSPELSVIVTEKQTYTVEYELETQYVLNENLYNTEQRVLVQGKTGTKEIIADVIYKNGTEVARDIISETVRDEAVATVIELGTEIPPTYMKPISGGTLTSVFGERWGTLHKGVDWSCSVGTSVKASSKGTVSQAGWVNGYGYCITINHPDGKQTRYGHLSEILVNEGQKVEQSEVIGLSGNTGNSTGPHVHFEIIEDGTPVNPFLYLQ